MISIEQYEVTDLKAGASNKTLKDIDPDKVYWSCFSCESDPRDDNCIFINEEYNTFGMGHSVVFMTDSFVLSMITHIPERSAHQIYNDKAWIVFRTDNIKVICKTSKVEHYKHGSLSIQGHRLALEEGAEYGFIQFYSVPEICQYEMNIYGPKELITFMVYRDYKAKEQLVQPPVINYRMVVDAQTYVTLLPGQRFQLVLHHSAQIDTGSLDKVTVVKRELHPLVHGNTVSTLVLSCDEVVSLNETLLIFVTHNGHRKCLPVTFIPIIENDGMLYGSMLEPVEKGNIICNEYIMGINVTSEIPESYISDERYVESGYSDKEAILRFTKPLKHIKIEKSDGFWWIEHKPNPRLPMDRLI